MAHVVTQKLNRVEQSELELAVRYFSIISSINNIHLTNRQIQLLAFTAVKGTISSGGARKEFVEIFKSSVATLENIKHSLVKMGLISKQDGKYRVNQVFSKLNFGDSIQLVVNLKRTNGDSPNRESTDL